MWNSYLRKCWAYSISYHIWKKDSNSRTYCHGGGDGIVPGDFWNRCGQVYCSTNRGKWKDEMTCVSPLVEKPGNKVKWRRQFEAVARHGYQAVSAEHQISYLSSTVTVLPLEEESVLNLGCWEHHRWLRCRMVHVYKALWDGLVFIESLSRRHIF